MEAEIKTTTRLGVFETNSSSTHSICICTTSANSLYDTIIPDKNGDITLTGGEFGWERESYNDALTKANYAALCVKDSISDRVKIINEFLGETDTNPRLNMLRKVIMEQTGARDVIFELDGYIDHESHGTANGVFASEDTLREYVFNQKSVLYTSNDNGGGNWNRITGELDGDDDEPENAPAGYVWLG